jgi:hypothetical protein
MMANGHAPKSPHGPAAATNTTVKMTAVIGRTPQIHELAQRFPTGTSSHAWEANS